MGLNLILKVDSGTNLGPLSFLIVAHPVDKLLII